MRSLLLLVPLIELAMPSRIVAGGAALGQDLDSRVRPVYGDQKEGTDFTYKGSFGYHPLVISLAETMECLRLVNRSGNTASADGSENHLRELFPMFGRRFEQIIVRGDSAFAKQSIFDACEEAGHSFAIVSHQQQNFASLFEALPGEAWKPYRQREKNEVPVCKRRRRGCNPISVVIKRI